MKELIGNSANIALVETEGGTLRTTVEVILLVSEPKYQNDLSGFVKTRSVEDFRFATSAKGLREIARQFSELANDAEELEERVTLQPRNNEGA